MSTMFEIYYKEPVNLDREEKITRKMVEFGGELTFREEPTYHLMRAIVLTYEFASREQAVRAADEAVRLGEVVKGFSDC